MIRWQAALSVSGMLVIPQCWAYFQAARKEHGFIYLIFFCRILWQPNTADLCHCCLKGIRLFWENSLIFLKQPCGRCCFISEGKINKVPHLHSAATLLLNLWDIRNVLQLRKFSHQRSENLWSFMCKLPIPLKFNDLSTASVVSYVFSIYLHVMRD